MSAKDLFQRSLHACRYVVMPLLEWFAIFTRRAQTLFEIRGEKPAKHRRLICFPPSHIGALALMGEILEAQAERKGAIGINDAAEFVQKFRLAVRGQAHHFVFVAEFPKANVLRESGVVHTQRMRESDLTDHSHPRTFA